MHSALSQSIQDVAARHEAARRPSPRASGRLLAAALGLGAAAAALLGLPPSTYRARAIVYVGDAPAALRPAATRAAMAGAVSKPVIERAAASLIGTDVAVPVPSLAERAAVTSGLDGATGRAARLAAALVPRVHAVAGEVPGTVDIVAETDAASPAAHIATAVAEAFVAEEEARATEAARKREISVLARLDALRIEAEAAHRKLATLGGLDVDPAQAHAAATQQVAAAAARFDAFKAILASGTPPLADRRDAPQTIDALQTVYLDNVQKLAKARETLGERHFTVIGLAEAVRRAGAGLTAEWKRLARVAETDLSAARQREADARKAEAPADAGRRAALDEARRAAAGADDALARARSAAPLSASDLGPRLIAPAAVPTDPVGLSLLLRLLLAAAAGLAAAALALTGAFVASRLTWARPAAATVDLVPQAEPASAPAGPAPVRPDPVSYFDDDREDEAPRRIPARVPPPPARVALRQAPHRAEAGRHELDLHEPDLHEPDLHEPDPRDFDLREPDPAPSDFDDDTDPRPAFTERKAPMLAPNRVMPPELKAALQDLAAGFETIEPTSGPLPTIMVASNESAGGTAPIALALARAAADIGWRVLLIEGPRALPELAAATRADADPILVDTFGMLRVVLQADRSDRLFLAPLLGDGARIASALARNTRAPLIDDVAAAFDVIVVDGGRAADSAADGWTADAFLRVGRFAAPRDDAHFLATFDAEPETLVGAVVGATFMPKDRPDRRFARDLPPVLQPTPRPTPKPVPRPVAAAPQAAPRRPVQATMRPSTARRGASAYGAQRA